MMAERLATVPEETTNGFVAASPPPPRSPYRDWIRMVAVSGEKIRSTLFSNSQSSHNGSSYSSDSGASSSYPSNNSGGSSGSASAAAPDLGFHELTMIARQMVNDGYTKHMVQAFNAASPPEPALAIWFSELDIDWVLQISEVCGSGHQVQLQDKSASSLQGLVEKWIRALTVIVVSITELVSVSAQHGTFEIARFGKASIAKMLVFVDAIVPAEKAENLRAVLDMYVCVSNASYMFTSLEMSPDAPSIFTEIGSSLAREVNRLDSAILSTMKEVRTLVEDDDLWAIEFPRGGGEVHGNTRFMVDCIVSMRKALATSENSAPSYNTQHLRVLINGTMYDLPGLLLRKSMLCSDLSLRYIFLVNNFSFIENVFKQFVPVDYDMWLCKLKRDCEKHVDSYLDVSWGHVISCIPKSGFSQPLIHRWSNTSLLANFESAFHKTYQTQKFWKVPEPRIRNLLRKSIAKRVISVYRHCLEENPELQKHVKAGNSSRPAVLEEMLRELFEG